MLWGAYGMVQRADCKLHIPEIYYRILFGKPSEETQNYDNNTYLKNYTYLGIVEETKDDLIRLEQKNKFSVGEEIEIMKPDGTDVTTKVLAIYDSERQAQDSAPHARQILWVKLDREASDTIF